MLSSRRGTSLFGAVTIISGVNGTLGKRFQEEEEGGQREGIQLIWCLPGTEIAGGRLTGVWGGDGWTFGFSFGMVKRGEWVGDVPFMAVIWGRKKRGRKLRRILAGNVLRD